MVPDYFILYCRHVSGAWLPVAASDDLVTIRDWAKNLRHTCRKPTDEVRIISSEDGKEVDQ